jgi:hypothetical protein
MESTKRVDLDGMNIISNILTSPGLNMGLNLETVEEVPHTESIIEIERTPDDEQEWANNPATASWGPLMEEVCNLWSAPAVSTQR